IGRISAICNVDWVLLPATHGDRHSLAESAKIKGNLVNPSGFFSNDWVAVRADESHGAAFVPLMQQPVSQRYVALPHRDDHSTQMGRNNAAQNLYRSRLL